jgi:hypothetical protein
MRQRLHVHGIRLDDPVFARLGDHWIHIDSPRTARRLLGDTPTPVLVAPADQELTPRVASLRTSVGRGCWWATLDPRACTGRKGLAADTTGFLYSLPDHQRAAALLSVADGAFLADDATAYLRDRLDDQLRAELVASLFIWSTRDADTGRGLDTRYWGRLVEEDIPVPPVTRLEGVSEVAHHIAQGYVTGAQFRTTSPTEQLAVLAGLWLWAGGRIRSSFLRRAHGGVRLLTKRQHLHAPLRERHAEARLREHLLDVLATVFNTKKESRYTPKVEVLTVRSYDGGRLLLADPVFSALGSGVAEVPAKDLKGLGAQRTTFAPGAEVEVLWTGRYEKTGVRLMSVKLATRVESWETLCQMLDGPGWVDGAVRAVVPGGLRLDVLGVEAFLPASLAPDDAGDLASLVGTRLAVAPVQLSPRTLSVVVSHREARIREQAAAADAGRAEAFGRLEVGQRFDSTVSKWVNFGIFVDLDGIDGLCHVSELGDLSQAELPEGAPVSVEVADIDHELRRVALRLAA